MKEEAFLTWVKTTSGEEPIVTIEKRPRPKTTAGKDEQGEVIHEGAFIGWDGETVDFAPGEFLPATEHRRISAGSGLASGGDAWEGLFPIVLDTSVPKDRILVRLGGVTVLELKVEMVFGPDGKPAYVNLTPLRKVAE